MSVAAEPIDRRTASGDDYAIELRDIVKRFPGVVANDGVNLKVRRGTIHAIVGENGAGKSTLMKTLYGAHQPDEGTILVDGDVQHFRSPAAAIRPRHRHGLPALHARRQLHGVGEHRPRQRARLARARSQRGARRRIRAFSSRYGLNVDPDELVVRPRRRREAACRDPQGALPRRRDPHPRRADRGARPPRGRRAVRLAARAHRAARRR